MLIGSFKLIKSLDQIRLVEYDFVPALFYFCRVFRPPKYKKTGCDPDIWRGIHFLLFFGSMRYLIQTNESYAIAK